MPHELVIDEQRRNAEITISGPKKNSLDHDGIVDLHALIEIAIGHPSVRSVILTGEGGNFCGGRIRNMALVSKEEISTDLAPILAMNQLLENVPVPVIAAVEGTAHGFGFGLSTLCDISIASQGASFALTELAHGIPPLIVLSYLFRFLPYKIAFDLALTGREMNATEASRLGLVTEVTENGQALETARALAGHIGELDHEAITLLREFARSTASLINGENAAYGAERIADLLAKANTKERNDPPFKQSQS